jgi:hypothetical protein
MMAFRNSDAIDGTCHHKSSEQCQQLGASLNLKAACPNRNDQTCKVSCQDPTSPSQCVVLDTLLIDGSPCGQFTLFSMLCPFPLRRTTLTGYGGTCQNGTCQSPSLLKTAKVTRASFPFQPDPRSIAHPFTSLPPWVSHRPGICKIYRSQFRSLWRQPSSSSP